MAQFKEDWEIPGHWFDYFEFFGIKEDATKEEIEKVYTTMRKKYHPDCNLNNPNAQEIFKKVYIVYNVLSNVEKRNAYYRDFLKRKGQANTQNTQQPNQNNTYTQQENTSKNQTENQNNNVTFDDLVSFYKNNPDDYTIKGNLKKALQIIFTSFQDYGDSVSEVYQALYKNLYERKINEEEYIDIREDLKKLIHEQLANIQEFMNVYSSIILNFNMEENFKKMVSIYRFQIKILSKSYNEALKYAKKNQDEVFRNYYYEPNTFLRSFLKKLQDANKLYADLLRKIEDQKSDAKTKDEVLKLLENYQKMLNNLTELQDYGSQKGIHNKTLEDSISLYKATINYKIEEVEKLIQNFDFVIELQNIGMEAKNISQDLLTYNDISIVMQMMDNGTLNESKFEKIKKHICEKQEQLEDRISKARIKHSAKDYKQSIQNIEEILAQNTKNISDSLLFQYKWSEFLQYMQGKKAEKQREKQEKEAEAKAAELIE